MSTQYDVIVVGGGHAGSEAAFAAATLGMQTLLLTNNIDQIASMPCNPAIGGPAKSHLVKEIDALGGLMGLAADATYLQMKTLNSSKGPATRALRAQSDKKEYSAYVRQILENTKNLEIYQSAAKALIFDGNKAVGIETSLDEKISAKAIVLTAGTFLEGRTFTGKKFQAAGRAGEKPSLGLAPQINSLGLRTGRLKTGTPARLDKRTINFEGLEVAPGDEKLSFFSFLPNRPVRRQYPCHITRTNLDTHAIIMENLDKSPMYSGEIAANGPRYCPSIEDKVVRFKDNPSHHFFLEPEGLNTNEIYLQGCSTSLPVEVQKAILKTLPGLEKARITRPAYAVEYDYFPGVQFKHNFEAKLIDSLFVAGQVLGTSGYEEAAAQGLMAGVNAAIKAFHQTKDTEVSDNFNPRFIKFAAENQEFLLGRNNSYIGTLVDDLVSKEINDPYRMLTSRSEYRLLLRQDNADQRLTEIGYQLGLASDFRYQIYNQKQERLAREVKFCEIAKISQKSLGDLLEIKGGEKTSISELLKRPEFDHKVLVDLNLPSMLSEDSQRELQKKDLNLNEIRYAYELEVVIKYAGYIKRQQQTIKELQKIEQVKVPEGFDFKNCLRISLEARDKLSLVNPKTLGQASRVGGVTPNDVSTLMILFKSTEVLA
jgi:tRNA uridine 5-carboxymethylaminomethyl modification enzyme